jgi:hypothetical protein
MPNVNAPIIVKVYKIANVISDDFGLFSGSVLPLFGTTGTIFS